MASSDKQEIQQLKEKLDSEFEMKDLGNAKSILSMDILRVRRKGELFLSQHDYLKKVVERFRMTYYKVENKPLGHHSKLSIKQCPQSEDERKKMEGTPYASGVGSIMCGMVCSRPDLSYAISVGYVDADYAGNIDTRKSLLGFVFTLFGTAVTWKENQQSVVALSTTHAEYIATQAEYIALVEGLRKPYG
ncbi:putative retrotransposon Ty1-copia subclass protein [Trifolium pratense]|uniref:Putative retrotransposon Ty1-copia subclass protein n=1 Tax=Trifolium pratense TaxID=57577 RepID=A0A2K3K0W3_TRIPR|nr:putative retrotransposon Ty1-copia subclass protein [Trifolium pratense]